MPTKFSQQPQPLMKPKHFFKIITDHSLQEGKLMIPNKFVEKYGADLPNTLFLKTPNGAEWKMNLEKQDGKIWFQKGWKEFAVYHSLAHGHLLVFGGKSTCYIQVHICDLSGLEIDYPPKTKQGKKVSDNERNKTPKDENLEYHRPDQKRKDKSPSKFHQPYQMRSWKYVKKVVLPHTGTKSKEKSKATAKQVSALDRASSFQPSNPFFLVVMRPSYASSCGRLSLPVKFCRRYFDLHKKEGCINLQVLDGKVWPAMYAIFQKKTIQKFRLSRETWKEFVEHNNLKVDDVCIFELIDTTELTFLVHIFRDADSANCSTSQGKAMNIGKKKKVKAVDRASCFRTCYPSFMVVIYPSYVSGGAVHFPSKFCKEHIDLHNKKKGDTNLQVLNGRVWSVRYRTRPYHPSRFELSTGWKTFADDNNLKVGDVCIFELIPETKLTFQVHIFRDPDNSKCSTSQDSG